MQQSPGLTEVYCPFCGKHKRGSAERWNGRCQPPDTAISLLCICRTAIAGLSVTNRRDGSAVSGPVGTMRSWGLLFDHLIGEREQWSMI